MGNFISRGFGGGRARDREEYGDRIPPGQYLERGFPVLTAGPTPRIAADEWAFKIEGMVGNPREWSAEEFRALPFETVPCDIHCVTKWSKLGTNFGGVSLDVLLGEAQPDGAYAMAHSYGGDTTNTPGGGLAGGEGGGGGGQQGGAPPPRAGGGPAAPLAPP